jgi:predicted MFS family arabinose efflux permease
MILLGVQCLLVQRSHVPRRAQNVSILTLPETLRADFRNPALVMTFAIFVGWCSCTSGNCTYIYLRHSPITSSGVSASLVVRLDEGFESWNGPRYSITPRLWLSELNCALR